MTVMTDSMETAVLNTARGSALAAWTPYAALLTAASAPESGTVTEIAYTGYARQAVTFGAPADASGAQVMSNSTLVGFPTMTAGTGGTATHVGIFDALTGGTLRYCIPLGSTQLVAVGSTPQFAVGQLAVGQS